MSKPRDTLSLKSWNSFANVNTAWPDCSDLCPPVVSLVWLRCTFIITHITVSHYIITDSQLPNSWLMTSKMLEEEREVSSTPILRFTFHLIILGGWMVGGLSVKLVWLEPDTGARQFYCIVGLLADWNESISSRLPDPWSLLQKGHCMTSKGNTAWGKFHTRTNT